jgi:hypothetical protein
MIVDAAWCASEAPKAATRPKREAKIEFPNVSLPGSLAPWRDALFWYAGQIA